MTTIGGLPAHILLVHAVVVLVPLTALLVTLVAVWPSMRRRLASATAVLAVLTLITVPLTTDAGEWLEGQVESTALLRTHTELGDTMLPWAVALAVVALALLGRELLARRTYRRVASGTADGGPGTTRAASADPVVGRRSAAGPGGRAVSLALAIVTLVVAAGSVFTVYRIGDSGSRAVWTGRFSQDGATPASGRGSGSLPGG